MSFFSGEEGGGSYFFPSCLGEGHNFFQDFLGEGHNFFKSIFIEKVNYEYPARGGGTPYIRMIGMTVVFFRG